MATIDVNHEKKTIFDYYWWFNKYLNKNNESTDALFIPTENHFGKYTNKINGTDYRTYNLKGNEIRFHIKSEDISYINYINNYYIISKFLSFDDNIRNRLQYFDGSVRVFDKDVGFKDITYRLFIQYLNNGDKSYPAKDRVEMSIKMNNYKRTKFYDYSEFGGKEEATQFWLNGGDLFSKYIKPDYYIEAYNNMHKFTNNPNVNCLIIFDEPVLQDENTILKIGYDYEFVRDPFTEIMTQE